MTDRPVLCCYHVVVRRVPPSTHQWDNATASVSGKRVGLHSDGRLLPDWIEMKRLYSDDRVALYGVATVQPCGVVSEAVRALLTKFVGECVYTVVGV